MAGLSLVRFTENGSGPCLGLVRDDIVSNLTATGQPQFASLASWLRYASGRAKRAIDELMVTVAPKVASFDALVGIDGGPTCLAPLDTQEVWACGVTYEMSREARMRESEEPTIYGRVYDAPRPEIFFKATPHRVVGPGEAVAIRQDSTWDVPEPEMALVVTPAMEIVGYTVGNDMSSRSIEGDNPLYLPQAKVYDRCCALGPAIRLATDFDPLDQDVRCEIRREGKIVFSGETHTRTIHRSLDELVAYLGRCNSFPSGVLVCTGTGIVPPDTFTLAEGDIVDITFEGLGTLSNPVVELKLD